MSLSKIGIQNEGDKAFLASNNYIKDIHIVRNGLYFDFGSLLFFKDDQGNYFTKANVDGAFPNLVYGITTNLKPANVTPVNGVYSYTNSAIEIDSTNLKLRAFPLTSSNTKGLSTFFLLISCKENDTAAPLSEVLRIFVHDHIIDFWLTPSSLTLRPVLDNDRNNRNSKLTIYALFSGDYYADITDLHGLQVSSATPQVLVNAYNAQTHPDMLYQNVLYPADESDSAFPVTPSEHTVSLSIPDTLKITTAVTQNGQTVYQIDNSPVNTKTVNAIVKLTKWVNGSTIPIKHIIGPLEKSATTTNVLFVSEGFTDPADFENYLTVILEGMKTSSAIPYNFLCSDQYPSVNFYSLFIPSSENASSLGEPYFPIYGRSNYYENFEDALRVERKYITMTPPTEDFERYGSQKSSVQKLMQLLGYANTEIVPSTLTVSTFMNPSDTTAKGTAYFNTLNSLVDLVDMTEFKDAFPDIFDDMTIDSDSFSNACRAWANTTQKFILFNEVDTAFGVLSGERSSMTNLHNRYVEEGFSIRRYKSKNLLENVFSNLSLDGNVINYFAADGKDTRNIVFIAKSAEPSASNSDTKGFFLNVSKDVFKEIRSVKSGNQYSLKPIEASSKLKQYNSNALSIIHSFAHEFTHSFDINDEYDREKRGSALSSDSDVEIDTSANNITVYRLLKSDDETKVDFSKLKWNRYAYSAVIKMEFISGTQFQIVDQELGNIKAGDAIIITNLESNKIMADNSNEKYTDLIVLVEGNVDSANNRLTVTLPPSGSISYLRNFEAGKPYYALKLYRKDTNSPWVKLVAPAIVTKLVERNGSITMDSTGPLSNFKQIGLFDESDAYEESRITNGVVHSVVQAVKEDNLPISQLNTISGLGKKGMSNIIGLYVGGGEYQRNVYHPTGRCMMRADVAGGNAPLPLCPVCSYHILLAIDYTKVKNYFANFLIKNEDLPSIKGAEKSIQSLGKYFLSELNDLS